MAAKRKTRKACLRLKNPPQATKAVGVFIFPTMDVHKKVQRFVARLVKAGRSVRIVRRSGNTPCGAGIYVYSSKSKR